MPSEGLWEIYDGTASEVEMGDFLFGLIRMLKPKLTVETGTYLGSTSRRIAKAISQNGFGEFVTCDVIRPTTLGIEWGWSYVQCSSLDLPELRTADLVYSDSLVALRIQEYELVKPGCVFVIHDTNHADDWTPKLKNWVHAKGGVTFPAGRGFGILVKPQ